MSQRNDPANLTVIEYIIVTQISLRRPLWSFSTSALLTV